MRAAGGLTEHPTGGRPMTETIPDLTVLPKPLRDRIRVEPSGCWSWTGFVDRDGYGRFRHTGAHRLVYEALVGKLSPELDLDHLCHNRSTGCPSNNRCPHRRCVRHDHVAPIPRAVHNRIGTKWNSLKDRCDSGHLFDEENTYWRLDRPKVHGSFGRECKMCRREAVRKYQAAKRTAS